MASAHTLDLQTIEKVYKEAHKERRQPTEEEREKAAKAVAEDGHFQRFLANLNIDRLGEDLIHFGKDDEIVQDLKRVMDYVAEKLNADSQYKGQLYKVGSCVDGSKVEKVDEADTLFVLNEKIDAKIDHKTGSITINGVSSPADYVSAFADSVEAILGSISLKTYGQMEHGGFLGPVFSGVRYNGPAVTALFTNDRGHELSLDITPVFQLPSFSNDLFTIKDNVSRLLKPLRQETKERILDVEYVYLFPNTFSDQWCPTTAFCEARLLDGMSRKSPFKMAYCIIKIISSQLNGVNKKGIFLNDPVKSDTPHWIEKTIMDICDASKSDKSNKHDERRIMRYGHAFLSKTHASDYQETGKNPIAINTTAFKYILLQEALANPAYTFDSQASNEEVGELILKAFGKFITLENDTVCHTLLDCKVDKFSISKLSLLNGTAPFLQSVLIEQCRQIYEKIQLPCPE